MKARLRSGLSTLCYARESNSRIGISTGHCPSVECLERRVSFTKGSASERLARTLSVVGSVGVDLVDEKVDLW